MSAAAKELSDLTLEETIVYEPNSNVTGLDRPVGSPDMPKSTPQGQHRYMFGSGARPLDGYTIKRAIGRGGFGEVYYATSDSGKEVALKLILHNLDVERRGVAQCMNLKCPNLLTIYDLKTNDTGESFVVMEYVAGPSLAQVLARHPNGLPLPEVRAWLKGLVEGVAYLHDHGIVHRDLKPANMFLEEGIVKIGDYGLAKLITPSHGTEHSESIGTCHYMAPEIASGKYHKPIDVYAIGIILYEMLSGRVPFEGESVGEVLMKHLTARPDLSRLSEPYRSIVAKALAKDPNHRPGRVHDLLPPEDAPAKPGIRFIGDGKVTASPPPERAPGGDDVLLIPAEEPVFYIGPETRPPRPAADRCRLRRLGLAPPRGPAAATPRPRARRAVLRPVARPAPTPPEPPPPLPSGRVRIAELAMGMLWTAPLVGLFSIVAAALLGLDPAARPQEFAHLVGLALLGTWGVLIPSKVMEGRTLDPTTRRVVFAGVGVGLGALSVLLASWLRMPYVLGFALDAPRAELRPGTDDPSGRRAREGLVLLRARLFPQRLVEAGGPRPQGAVPGLADFLRGVARRRPTARLAISAARRGSRRRPDRRRHPTGQPLERARRALRPLEPEAQGRLSRNCKERWRLRKDRWQISNLRFQIRLL